MGLIDSYIDYITSGGRAAATMAGNMAMTPGAGIAGLTSLISGDPGNLNSAEKVINDAMGYTNFTRTPEDVEKLNAINKVLNYIPEKSGEGWGMLGKATGIPYLEPAGNVFGQVAGLGAMMGAPKALQTRAAMPFRSLEGLLGEQPTPVTPSPYMDIGHIVNNERGSVTKGASLIEEAKKYKSAEEFVKAQKKIYHGTSTDIANQIEKSGFDINKTSDGTIWFTDNPKIGEVGASSKGGIIERIVDENNLKLGGWAESDKYSIGELLQQGYDGLKLVDGGEITYQIFNPKKLQTQSQLTDIWNKAQEKTSVRGISIELEKKGIDNSIYEKDGAIYLSKIKLPENMRNKGIGSEAIKSICDYADKTNQPILLTPSVDFGASSVSRLEKFYNKFGFKNNKGNKKDYRYRETMIRKPILNEIK